MKFPNIEAERIKREVNKDQFSHALGVSRRTISNWQNGKTERFKIDYNCQLVSRYYRLSSGTDHRAYERGQARVETQADRCRL